MKCRVNFILSLIFLTCVKNGICANILAVFPMPGKSHFVMFERLLVGLAEKGHSVDVATHFPTSNPPEGYNVLSLKGSLPIFLNNLSVNTFLDFSPHQMTGFIAGPLGYESCEGVLKSKALRDLLKTEKKYDLLVTEIFGSDCMLGFGHHFKVPTISMISSVDLPWGSGSRIGNPDNPAYIPNYFESYSPRMTFFERFKNTITLTYTKLLYHYWFNKESNRVAKEFFGQDLPLLEELALNTSLVMINTHFSMNQPRPTVPNFIEVGGLHIKDPQPLSQKFKDLVQVDGTKYKGVIFLTMGSMIMTETFVPERLQGIFDAFAELPYKVLWKAEREKFPKNLTIPPNIFFENWMPQLDILCHPNVKMFVSHGGLMGSQEAVYCGVPRLGIPLFADQENNIRLSERQGLTIRVGYHEITKESILRASLKLLNDPSYTENVQRISYEFRDRPMSTLDTAIYWVEYVIRHKGAPNLRSAGADLPWYQYHLLDVVFVIIGLTIVVPMYLIKRLATKVNSKSKLD